MNTLNTASLRSLKRVEDVDDDLAEAIDNISKLRDMFEYLEKVAGALASVIKGYEESGLKYKIDKPSMQVEALEREIKSLHTISARHGRKEADLREA